METFYDTLEGVIELIMYLAALAFLVIVLSQFNVLSFKMADRITGSNLVMNQYEIKKNTIMKGTTLKFLQFNKEFQFKDKYNAAIKIESDKNYFILNSGEFDIIRIEEVP